MARVSHNELDVGVLSAKHTEHLVRKRLTNRVDAFEIQGHTFELIYPSIANSKALSAL